MSDIVQMAPVRKRRWPKFAIAGGIVAVLGYLLSLGIDKVQTAARQMRDV